MVEIYRGMPYSFPLTNESGFGVNNTPKVVLLNKQSNKYYIGVCSAIGTDNKRYNVTFSAELTQKMLQGIYRIEIYNSDQTHLYGYSDNYAKVMDVAKTDGMDNGGETAPITPASLAVIANNFTLDTDNNRYRYLCAKTLLYEIVGNGGSVLASGVLSDLIGAPSTQTWTFGGADYIRIITDYGTIEYARLTFRVVDGTGEDIISCSISAEDNNTTCYVNIYNISLNGQIVELS